MDAKSPWEEKDISAVGSIQLACIVREEVLYAEEMLRAEHDPASDWSGFVTALSEVLGGVLGFDAAERRWCRQVEAAVDEDGRLSLDDLEDLARRLLEG